MAGGRHVTGDRLKIPIGGLGTVFRPPDRYDMTPPYIGGAAAGTKPAGPAVGRLLAYFCFRIEMQ
jgi:hypothetical protein